MGNFFPRWSNWVPLQIAVCLGFLVVGVVAGATYYFTPKYTRVGYEPTQPVPFSHKQHVGELGLDCRYCHSYVEQSSHANVPTNQTCYNCHGPDKIQVKKDSPKLEMVRNADKSGHPIQWTKVHKAPDYVYFNHSVHISRGVSCVSCHGQINEMEVVKHAEPQSMGWCLECHREPENKLRPLDQITNLTYKPEDLVRDQFYKGLESKGAKVQDLAQVILGDKKAESLPGDISGLVALAEKTYGPKVTQKEVGTQLKHNWRITPPEDCTACHR
jgi:formate-dependent nitrite reductase cytochrome c552 subunit